MRTFNEKVKQFVENNFEKIVKIFFYSGKNARFPAFYPKSDFFIFFFFLPIRIANTIRKPAKTWFVWTFFIQSNPIRWFIFNKNAELCAVGWDCPTRRVNYIYSTHFSFVKHRLTAGVGVTGYLCHPSPTLRMISPPVARSATPPAPESTHANFVCAGPGVVRWALVRSRHGGVLPTIWAVALDHPALRAPLHRGELRPRRYWGSTPIRRKGVTRTATGRWALARPMQ